MIFIERLGFGDVLRLRFSGRPARYATKSLGARLAERILRRPGGLPDVAKIDFGDVEVARDIRGRAYRLAERVIDALPGERWARSLSPVLGIDFWLVVRKFFFDELYIKYEFIEMAIRHAEENAGEPHQIDVTPEFLGDYDERVARCFTVGHSTGTSRLGAATVLLLPLFIEYFWRTRGRRETLNLNGRIVCEVDGDKTLEMFASLFHQVPKEGIAFVCEQRNAGAFTDASVIGVLGLRKDGLDYLRRVVWPYIGQSLSSFSDISRFGNRLFRIFYIIMQGKAEALEGSNNAYFTYEHLITPKAVRNEFLRAAGNRTVFVPMNGHVTPLYFHSEIFVNYDVMCSAGPHIEVLYRKKRALTQQYLPTGSYESHRGSVRVDGKAERVALLKRFRDGKVGITIISPGICDPTYRHEVKLMGLARRLSMLPNVRVTIRLKPVQPLPKYARFYEEHTAGCEGILLTSGEYDLFDLLETTDLFLTTISNAAFDLVQAGAQAMFLDYLNDPELMLCWSAVEGLPVPEEDAWQTVLAWVDDEADARSLWRERMRRLAAHVAYQAPDFETYRQNFTRQLGAAKLGVASF